LDSNPAFAAATANAALLFIAYRNQLLLAFLCPPQLNSGAGFILILQGVMLARRVFLFWFVCDFHGVQIGGDSAGSDPEKSANGPDIPSEPFRAVKGAVLDLSDDCCFWLL
jgi:hypothetical protein